MDERIKNALLQIIENFRKKNEKLDPVTGAFLIQLTYAINFDTSQLEDNSAEYDEYLADEWEEQEKKGLFPSGELPEEPDNGREAHLAEIGEKYQGNTDGRCCKPAR